MTVRDAKRAIQALLEGGQHRPDVAEALSISLSALEHEEEREARAANWPQNACRPWTASEEAELRGEVAARKTIPEIARDHGRSETAILTRLMRLGIGLYLLPSSSASSQALPVSL